MWLYLIALCKPKLSSDGTLLAAAGREQVEGRICHGFGEQTWGAALEL